MLYYLHSRKFSSRQKEGFQLKKKKKFDSKKKAIEYSQSNPVLDIFKEKDHYIITVEDVENNELSKTEPKSNSKVQSTKFVYPTHLAQENLQDVPSPKLMKYLQGLANKYDTDALDKIALIESKKEAFNWMAYFKKKYNLQKSHWKTEEPSEKQINYLISLVDQYQPEDFPDIHSIKTKKQASEWINKIKNRYEH